RQLAQHADIIGGLETLGENERLAAHFVERVLELGHAVRRIDVNQDETGFGAGELGENPFTGVGRPDADAVAGLEAERQKSGGELVNGVPQLRIAEPDILTTNEERRAG